MSKINLNFKGKNYSIDKSLLAGAIADLEAHFSGMSGGSDAPTSSTLEGDGARVLYSSTYRTNIPFY